MATVSEVGNRSSNSFNEYVESALLAVQDGFRRAERVFRSTGSYNSLLRCVYSGLAVWEKAKGHIEKAPMNLLNRVTTARMVINACALVSSLNYFTRCNNATGELKCLEQLRQGQVLRFLGNVGLMAGRIGLTWSALCDIGLINAARAAALIGDKVPLLATLTRPLAAVPFINIFFGLGLSALAGHRAMQIFEASSNTAPTCSLNKRPYYIVDLMSITTDVAFCVLCCVPLVPLPALLAVGGISAALAVTAAFIKP